MHLGNGSQPAPVQLAVKPFPWPPFTLDLAATAAASAFNLLIVFAFLNPVRSVVVTIVREKELRLREGMRILGLTVSAVPCECAFFPCKFKLWGQPELRLREGMRPLVLTVSGVHSGWVLVWDSPSCGGSQNCFAGRECAFWASRQALCTLGGCHFATVRAVGAARIALQVGMRILGLTVSAVPCECAFFPCKFKLWGSQSCGCGRACALWGSR